MNSLPIKKIAVDLVMCIDCSESMGEFLDNFKRQTLTFYPSLKKRYEEIGRAISELRIRVIGFHGFYTDSSASIEDSGFFNIPDQETEFKNFVNRLEPTGGGDEPENGLEALALAMQSDWTTGEGKRCHVIVVCTDASSQQLEYEPTKNEFYTQDMPINFDELTDWWENERTGKMNNYAKRLILFAPDLSPWTEIGENWNKTIHHPVKTGMGLEEFDYRVILESICHTI